VELTDLDLYEVGPTPIGANPDAHLISAKAGRVLSAKNIETITSAREALKAADKALGELLKLSSDDGKSAPPNRKATAEEPARVNAQEPTVSNVDSVLALIQLAEL
jgi:hypothetical protein